ncbi:MAG: HAD family hydrolase, partial [Raoultibacter sp.]
GPQYREVVKRVLKSGTAESANEVVAFWHRAFVRLMDEYSGEQYRPQRELARMSFQQTIERFQAQADPDELTDLMVEYWCNPPLYDDTKDFLAQLEVPIYLVTNSDDQFVDAAMAFHGLSATGVFTSEQARFAKPNPKIFEYALAQTGLKSYEVVHIGDSVDNDYRCPASIGIEPIWLNRDNLPARQVTRKASDLAQACKIASLM